MSRITWNPPRARKKRAKRIDASIRRSLGDYEELEEPVKKEEKAFRYIS